MAIYSSGTDWFLFQMYIFFMVFYLVNCQQKKSPKHNIIHHYLLVTFSCLQFSFSAWIKSPYIVIWTNKVQIKVVYHYTQPDTVNIQGPRKVAYGKKGKLRKTPLSAAALLLAPSSRTYMVPIIATVRCRATKLKCELPYL